MQKWKEEEEEEQGEKLEHKRWLMTATPTIQNVAKTTELNMSSFTPVFRVLWDVIVKILAPAGGHYTDISFAGMHFLYGLVLKERINFGAFALGYMENCSITAGKKKRNLPYGRIITRILEHFGIASGSATVGSDQDFINEDSLKKQNLKLYNGEWKFGLKGMRSTKTPGTNRPEFIFDDTKQPENPDDPRLDGAEMGTGAEGEEEAEEEVEEEEQEGQAEEPIPSIRELIQGISNRLDNMDMRMEAQANRVDERVTELDWRMQYIMENVLTPDQVAGYDAFYAAKLNENQASTSRRTKRRHDHRAQDDMDE